MNRVSAGDLGGGDQAHDVEVRLRSRCWTHTNRFIREADVKRLGVRLRMDGHGFEVEHAASADDPQRDLAAIGDQHLVDHGAVIAWCSPIPGRWSPRCRAGGGRTPPDWWRSTAPPAR